MDMTQTKRSELRFVTHIPCVWRADDIPSYATPNANWPLRKTAERLDELAPGHRAGWRIGLLWQGGVASPPV